MFTTAFNFLILGIIAGFCLHLIFSLFGKVIYECLQLIFKS
nr:MAG TPA: hypothetical protein [Inoviridae sp.]